MPNTEQELVAMLRERAQDAPPDPGRGERAAALGRRMRRRRRATRTAVTAGTAAAVAVTALALPGGADGTVPADTVLASVRLPAEVPLPGEADHFFRAEKLPLIESQQHERMGEPVRLRFTALSTDTMYNVRCSVPGSWLVIKSDDPARSASIGRCGPQDHLSQYDGQSAGPAWTGRPHTLEAWVLPPEAEIDESNPPDPFTDAIEKIAARTGTRPGIWAIGVYDRRG
ncbi:hypothetical protein ACQPZP_36380 [Spirillospora sp. CA-142024]|uniref:hypothetical protein n=1 Tax=Spirillospora sp. CA-142024 TaxID=3240036 RepID=UPI003D94BDD5